MAQKVITQLVDDVDGTELAEGEGETVTFALDGVTYEIDLSRANADNLRGAIHDWTVNARKVTSSRGRAKPKPAAGSGNAAEIRAWAKDKGLDVPDRGRIPQEIRDQFDSVN